MDSDLLRCWTVTQLFSVVLLGYGRGGGAIVAYWTNVSPQHVPVFVFDIWHAPAVEMKVTHDP